MPDANRLSREGRIRTIPLGKMRVSDVAQRELRPARVDYLVARFDLEELGYLTVNERDELFYIIDGQHRFEALKRWLGDGWELQQIPCITYSGKAEAEEAEKFLQLNNTLSVNAFAKFKVAVTAGRPIETDIVRTLTLHGNVLSTDEVPGAVRSPATLRKIYVRSGGDTLGRALRIANGAFGDAGLEGLVLDGLGHLCQRYDGNLNEDLAIAKLGKVNGGVNGLLGKAEVLRKQTGHQKAHCVAAAAVDIINSGRGQKIPSWWKS